jgi:hypothetical protein
VITFDLVETRIQLASEISRPGQAANDRSDRLIDGGTFVAAIVPLASQGG